MGHDADEIILISENQTRKELIDPLLAKMGWLKKYIKEEVNSVKSDFNNKHFVHFNLSRVEYSYDEAVRDKVLVPYNAEIIDTKVLSLGIKAGDLTSSLKDQIRRQEENPDYVEYTGAQFDKVFMDDKTNELIIREFMSLCYKSDEGKPCKTIFFCASRRHAQHMKDIFGKLFPNLSSDVQVITSNMDRAEDEVKRFQLQSEPRIALSVGMLDTGVDVG